MERWRPFLLAAIVFAVAGTWPWALMLGDHTGQVTSDPDLQCGMWWPSQFADAVLHLQNPFFDEDLLWPAGQDVTLLVWNFGAQLVFLPIHALFGPPLGMNLASLLTLVLNGLAAAWAGRAVTRSNAGAFAALALASTDVFAFSEGLNGRPEQALWAPNVLYLGALALLAQQPGRRRWLVLAGASLAAAGAVYWFYAYFLIFLTVGLALVRLARGRLLGVLDIVRVGALSAVFVAPFLLPIVYAFATNDASYTAVKEAAQDSYTQQARASLVLAHFAWPVFPGLDASRHISLFLLPILGYTLARGRGGAREIAGMGMVALILAFGPIVGGLGPEQEGRGYPTGPPLEIAGGVVYLPGILISKLPGYERFWWPYRWLGVALPAMALSAAWIVAQAHRRTLLLGLIVVGSLAQIAGGLRTRNTMGVPMPVPDVFDAIADMPWPAPVLQLPLSEHSNFVGFQALHGQPIGTGLATHIVGVADEATESALLTAIQSAGPTDSFDANRTWTAEEAGGVHYVVLFEQTNRGGPRDGLSVTPVLGPPFFTGDNVSVWAVPGVGEVPPAYVKRKLAPPLPPRH